MEEILKKFIEAGYNYASCRYESWEEDHADDICDENSYYYNSVDVNGFPHKVIFEEQMSEEIYHNYCDGTLSDSIDFFCIDIDLIALEEKNSQMYKELVNTYLFEYLEKGLNKFIEEKYYE